jgi:tryptophan aminotransferase
LLAGKPNPSTFPFTSLSFNARSPTHPDEESTLTIDGTELEQGLQYGDTAGLKSLLDWIQGLQELNHGRKKDEGWRISIGSGSQDLIYKVNFPSKLVGAHNDLNEFGISGSRCHG